MRFIAERSEPKRKQRARGRSKTARIKTRPSRFILNQTNPSKLEYFDVTDTKEGVRLAIRELELDPEPISADELKSGALQTTEIKRARFAVFYVPIEKATSHSLKRTLGPILNFAMRSKKSASRLTAYADLNEAAAIEGGYKSEIERLIDAGKDQEALALVIKGTAALNNIPKIAVKTLRPRPNPRAKYSDEVIRRNARAAAIFRAEWRKSPVPKWQRRRGVLVELVSARLSSEGFYAPSKKALSRLLAPVWSELTRNP